MYIRPNANERLYSVHRSHHLCITNNSAKIFVQGKRYTAFIEAKHGKKLLFILLKLIWSISSY